MKQIKLAIQEDSMWQQNTAGIPKQS